MTMLRSKSRCYASFRRWLFLLSLVLSLGATPPPPDSLASEVRERIETTPALPWPVVEVAVNGDAISLCLDLPPDVLQEEGGELIAEAVGQALLPLEWRTLHLLAYDPHTDHCRPWSDLLPQKPQVTVTGSPLPLLPALAPSEFSRSLAGKTVYVSAGHGWQWNGSRWRTQRPPYQQIIEDHNNAEAVLQYLIPYLENAGATVVPVRERDRSLDRVIADNDNPALYSDAGGWQTSGSPGYGGTYRFVQTTTGAATAAAEWTLNVPRTGRYALYAWVRSGSNRPPDARYTIQHAGGTAEVRLDQRIRPETWRYLGTFPFYAGVTTVTLDNHSVENGAYIVADALRLGGGFFDDLAGIDTTALSAPDKPWWEVATFYYSQWMGMAAPYGDVTARPIFSRWYHAGVDEDAVYISWHSNGYNGDNSTIWGTVSYVHNGDSYPRTAGSLELQQAVHDEIIQDLRAGWDANWRDLGKRQLNLGEVRLLWDSDPDNRMPGVLLELAYHDHVEDANALKEPRFNQLFARATYQGILHYFEERDGVDLVETPEPPTHLRVRNLGEGRVEVAWQPSPADGVGLRGDPATGYRLYTSPDGFAWGGPLAVSGLETTVEDLAEGETLYVRVTAVNEGGESLPTETLGARVGDLAPLLIVNGYDKLNRYGLVEEIDPTEGYNLRMWLERMNERDYVTHHGEVVPAAYAWESASNEAVADGFVDLADYRMVDWILGEESLEEDQTLNTDERLALEAFIEGGGALLISGSELAWNLVSVDVDFLRETLHVGYVADDAATYDVTPLSGGLFEGSNPLSFDAEEEYDADSPDVLAPVGAAQAVLAYGTGGTAAVAWASGCNRTLVMGFPLETVRPNAREGVMAQALAFLDACVPPALDVRISSPALDLGYRSTPPFTGTVSGAEPRRVEVQLRSLDDDEAWKELEWERGTWLTATGTSTWHHSLPALPEGQYAVGARAVFTDLVSGIATARFWIDATPPLDTALVTPTGGITVTGRPSLQWTAPGDSGSPLHYDLVIGDELRTVTDTRYAPLLAAGGPYTWTVRAVDRAGNTGPWAQPGSFSVDLYRVFLPLTLRDYATLSPLCEELLASGFESEGAWTYNSNAERVQEPVHEGEWSVRVGPSPGSAARGTTVYSSIAHMLSLPADRSITLYYWAYPVSEGNDGDDLHYVSLWDETGAVHILSTLTSNAQTWEARELDLSAYAGQEVTLFFGVKNDGDGERAALHLDEILVEACP